MASLEPGRTVSHYRILRRLGQGGQATAWQAEDLRLSRPVVLKTLRPELAGSDAARRRFEREACLCSSLDNPNICSVYDIGQTGDLSFIVMQYVDGPTLKQLIGGRPLETLTALSIAIQIADGLSVAHAAGVIHRDIKPTNVIVTPAGQAKVLDFGLAKATTEDAAPPDPHSDPLTDTGVPYGSMGYGSPEQASGQRVDHRSDVFSVGVVLYEMMTGLPPFKGEHTVATLHAVINSAPRPMRELNPDTPPELDAILDRAIAKRPRDRYQTMAALRDDLKTLMRRLSHETGVVPTEASVTLRPPRRGGRSWLGRMLGFGKPRATAAVATPTPTPAAPASRAVAAAVAARADDPVPTAPARPATWGTEVKKTLAVLPFRNIGGDASIDAFQLVLADGLVTELGALDSLVVRPSAYVAPYAGLAVDPRRVAEDLAVGWVLAGTLVRGADRVRVAVQLIAAASGEILWADKIDTPPDPIAAQDALNERTLAALRLHLAPASAEEAAEASGTRSAQAYEFYLRGREDLARFLLQTWAIEDLEQAIRMFNEAIGLDQGFAGAYAAVGRCYVLHGQGYGGPEYYRLGERALRRALELSPGLLEARVQLVHVELHHGGKDQARTDMAELREEAPDDPGVLMLAALLFRLDGMHEAALRELDRLVAVSPDSRVFAGWQRARLRLHQRRPGDAVAELDAARVDAPEHALVQACLAMAWLQQGKTEEAQALLSEVLRRHRDLDGLQPLLACCHLLRGNRARALTALGDSVRAAADADADVAFWLGSAHALDGDAVAAVRWLRRSVELGNEDWPLFASSPELDRVRDDARFRDLMAGVERGFKERSAGH